LIAARTAAVQAKAREANSLATTNHQVRKILGEYTDLPFYSPDPRQNICGAINELPTQHFDWPDNMISCIKQVWAHPATHLQLQNSDLNSWKKQQITILKSSENTTTILVEHLRHKRTHLLVQAKDSSPQTSFG
jgi:hypothetical protein